MTRWFSTLRGRVFGTAAAASVLGLSLCSTACTGILDGSGSSAAPGMPNGGTGTIGTIPGGGGSATVGGGSSAMASGYKAIHRLNSNEYNATVKDVLGTTLTPANGSWPVYELNGFDNMADVQIVDQDQYQRYFDASSAIAADVFAQPAFKTKYITCATSDDACVSGIIGNLGLHLFLRPLKPTEVTNYKTVYTAAQGQGEAHEGALKYVLSALLSSSEFLYRMEFDPNPNSAEKHPLSAYELATRLSYFLWSTAPDDALLAAAADSSISKDETLKSTVDRLLGNAANQARFVQNFYGQWLGGRRVAEHAVAPDVYTAWNPALADSLAQEMYAYFADFLNTDRSWLEFLTADENFVDGPLATLYGMPAPPAGTRQKVSVTTDKRVGFLGLAGFLAQSSLDRRTSPTLRGRWIMINLLCTQPPSPPKDVPNRGGGRCHRLVEGQRARRAREAPRQPGLRQLPRAVRSVRLAAGAVRRHRRVPRHLRRRLDYRARYHADRRHLAQGPERAGRHAQQRRALQAVHRRQHVQLQPRSHGGRQRSRRARRHSGDLEQRHASAVNPPADRRHRSWAKLSDSQRPSRAMRN